jgi:predicted HAD superfamily Cof-like phosphohydrolase
MTPFQKSVKTWMAAVGQSTPKSPSIPDNLTRTLRISLLLEEVLELAEASGVEVSFSEDGSKINIDDFNYNINGEVNLIEVADALADIDYVSAGAACSYGLDMEPFQNEVCRSNDSKLIDGYKRNDGKWIKGPKYSPAKLGPILRNQLDLSLAEEDQLKLDL